MMLLGSRLDFPATAVNIPFNDLESRFTGGGEVESDARFYRRRATEELAAASRAVTPEARDRRLQLAELFLSRLEGSPDGMLFEWDGADSGRPVRLERGRPVL